MSVGTVHVRSMRARASVCCALVYCTACVGGWLDGWMRVAVCMRVCACVRLRACVGTLVVDVSYPVS